VARPPRREPGLVDRLKIVDPRTVNHPPSGQGASLAAAGGLRKLKQAATLKKGDAPAARRPRREPAWSIVSRSSIWER
jgi:hypothetical protein